ncbi:MAG: hypothetical protein IJM59_04325 [Proteobacteria bacterium]|nr:hypothetical protein [Pseudomonadota bacterium]
MRWNCFIFLIIFVLFPLDIWAQDKTEPEEPESLENLENLARRQFDEGKPEAALELYRRYEKQMIEEGWDALQFDVLVNLATASYRSERLGEAMGYVKQLSIFRGVNVNKYIDELQMLIESRVYQKNPATKFIRGNSSDYTYWETAHRFSRAELHLAFFIIWCCIFLILTGYMVWGRSSRFRAIFIDLLVMSGLFLLIAGALLIAQKRTEDMKFGVLTEVSSLRTELGSDETGNLDGSFIPGMTVKVISHVPGWVRVERSDGALVWVDVHDFYLLRGWGEQHSAELE